MTKRKLERRDFVIDVCDDNKIGRIFLVSDGRGKSMTFMKGKFGRINDIKVSDSSMKILFIHSALRDYRRELFKKLHRKYDIEFIFVKQKKGKFGGIKMPDNWNYKNICLERDIKWVCSSRKKCPGVI